MKFGLFLHFTAFSQIAFCTIVRAEHIVPATGWDKDVVLGNGETYADHAKPLTNGFLWFSADSSVAAGNYGLPASGLVSASGRNFQLQPHTGYTNNAVSGDGAITLVTPAKFSEISILGSQAGNSEGGTLTLSFADNSTATHTLPGGAFPEWANGTSQVTPDPQLTNNGTSSSSSGAMGILILDLTNLGGTDYSNKMLSSITLTAGGSNTLFALNGVAAGLDLTPPTIPGSDIVDDQSGGPVLENTLVIYTLAFSEDIDEATVDATDFSNAGSAAITIGSITEITPGVFAVEVTPTTTGTLILRINAGAVINDVAGNPLDTTAAIIDTTTLTVTPTPDTTPPTLVATDIVDDQAGGPVIENTLVAYTLTFSEEIDEATVAAADFGNAGSAAITIGTITETSPGVFTVEVTPTTTGTLILQINAGAVINDVAGNPLNTIAAIVDDTTLTVTPTPDTTPPTLVATDIVDDQAGGPVIENTLVTYTLTFSEEIDDATVDLTDFGNAGSAAITIGSITEITPGVFTVQVTPTSTGTLIFQVNAGAVINDVAGNPLDTTTAIIDTTTLTVTPTPDTTPPTLAATDIVDDQAGGPVVENTLVTYTLTFSEDIDEATIDATDFGNAGSAAITIGTISESTPGAFTVEVTPTSTGTLIFQVNADAVINDVAGNPLETATAIVDETTIEVVLATPIITAPTTRHIVQRNAVNLGNIQIAGIYNSSVFDSIEARAVVMGGSGNSGTNTGWQVIDSTPVGGRFSGSLTAVPAGGWYQLEVRGVTGGSPSNSSVLEKVGVGDIYVTAGQSNSANDGTGGYIVVDDRVSARTAVTGSNWVRAADPIPIATGRVDGGSPWSRLGDLLAAAEDIPVGFIAVGVGGTRVQQWLPGTSNYNNRLKTAIQSFPVNGFRALLWHQGESDSDAGVNTATYASRLTTIIAQSRIDAGWNIPWYVAEASFHPSPTLFNEVRIAAAQRQVVHSDPLVFLGPSTDEFHLEDAAAGKLRDTVHFNAAGQLDHANQWKNILLGTTTLAPENPGFENNHTPSITGSSALADGATYLLTPLANRDSPMVLDWRILAASGVNAAEGDNGVHNPTAGTYAGAVDSANGGVLANMDGKHVAVLNGGSAGNYFLQSTRRHATPNTIYSLSVAIGVRENPATFGVARLEITANGAVAASATFDKTALDSLRGSDSSGTFTDTSVTWTTGSSVSTNQLLAFRIVKEGGAATVLDFDNVRFTSAAVNDFQYWISNSGFGIDPSSRGFHEDPDGDGIPNGIESWLGTHPGIATPGITELASDGLNISFSHSQNTSPPTDVGGYYEWSSNLIDWYPSGDGPEGEAAIAFSSVTVGTQTTVTATASEPIERFFLRIGVFEN